MFNFTPMICLESLILRTFEHYEWATAIFTFSFVLIAINRTIYNSKYHDFIRLFFSGKYLKFLKDVEYFSNFFTFSMFLIQLFSLAFFILLWFDQIGLLNKFLFFDFLRAFTAILYFILGKMLIEKIIANVFSIDTFFNHFNMIRTKYQSYIGLLLIVPVTVLYYQNEHTLIPLYLLALIIFMGYIWSYFRAVKLHQKQIIQKSFYFILYLCTLEIIPCFLVYYWIKIK